MTNRAPHAHARSTDDGLRFEPLRPAHLPELAAVLLDPAVYRHIETALPSPDEFESALRHAIAGPGASQADERWLNFLVRDAAGAMVGRLEATIHHGVAEVAFLFGPRYWGRGWASIGLRWLENEVARSTGVADFWATTARENIRCRRLLQRCGYVLARPPDIPLYSHDAGDLVFRRACAAG